MSPPPNEKVIQMDEQQPEATSKDVPCIAPLSSIFAKIANVMAKMERVEKNASNDFHKYKYASADAVFDICRRLMAEEKLVIIPRMENVHQADNSTNIDFTFTLCCGETGATLDVPWMGEATDKGDKGINKCATTALKYFLMKLFVIDTGHPENDADSGGETTSNSSSSSAPQGPVTFPISKIKVARQKKKPDQLMYVVEGSKKSAYLFTSDLFKAAGYDTSGWKLADKQPEKEVALDPPALVTVQQDDKGYLQVKAVEQSKPAQPKGTTNGDAKSTETDKASTKGKSSKGKSSTTSKKTRPKTLNIEIGEFDFDGDYGFVTVEEHASTIVIENPAELFETIVEEWPEGVTSDKHVTVELLVEVSLTCKAKITKEPETGEIMGHYVVTEAT